MSIPKFDNDLYDTLTSITESGPSFLLRLIIERVGGKMKVQPFNDYQTAVALAKAALPEYTRILKRAASGRGKVITNIKSEESWNDKTVARGKPANKIKDILRGSIIVPDDKTLDAVVEDLTKFAIVNDIDHKSVAKDEFGYYGPWHIDIEVGDGDQAIIAEVIIMTKRALAAKHESHQIYGRLRSDKSVPYEKSNEAMKDSRGLWDYANRPNRRDRSERKYGVKRTGRQDSIRKAFGDEDF